jgi:hypothetical protein
LCGGFLSGSAGKLKELSFSTKTLTLIPNTFVEASPFIFAQWRIIRPNDVIGQFINTSVMLSGSGKILSAANNDRLDIGVFVSATGLAGSWSQYNSASDFVTESFVARAVCNYSNQIATTVEYIAFAVNVPNIPNLGDATLQEFDAYVSMLLPLGTVVVRVI